MSRERDMVRESYLTFRVTTVFIGWDTFGEFPCNIIHTWSTSWAQLYFTWWPVKICLKLLKKKNRILPCYPSSETAGVGSVKGPFLSGYEQSKYLHQSAPRIDDFFQLHHSFSITLLISHRKIFTGLHNLFTGPSLSTKKLSVFFSRDKREQGWPKQYIMKACWYNTCL